MEDGFHEIARLMSKQFFIANLFTIHEDVSFEEWTNGKNKLRRGKPTFLKKPDRSHDKSKSRLINETHYLTALGVLDNKGRIQKDKGDKFKQINKFIEIIDGLIRQNEVLKNQKKVEVVDMGAGKGYLTFAVYDYLANHLNKNTHVKGVEIRPDLIKKCNKLTC